ncbi:MAG: redoxin domain-containing protein [Dehalococcoidia bacterium]|nr:redoxin domain-containing protein [Dehalococcoidia bacterium]
MARGAGRGDGVAVALMNPTMILQAVRTVVVLRLSALIVAAALVIGAVACERTDEVGPPATTIPPTQPAATSAPDTPVSEGTSQGSVSVGTPDDAASLSLEPTVEGSLEREPQVTPPALLPGTAEPTVPAVRSGTTPESEGPTPTDTPVPQPPAVVPPTDTPTPIPPTEAPAPPAPPTGTNVGQSAPDFEVTTADGITRSLTDYKQANQPVVLYFFATW